MIGATFVIAILAFWVSISNANRINKLEEERKQKEKENSKAFH